MLPHVPPAVPPHDPQDGAADGSRPTRPTRRDILRTGAGAGVTAGLAAGLTGFAGLPAVADESTGREPPRGREKTMTDVPFEGFDTVRVAIIGLGNRGAGQLPLFFPIPGARITALCDIRREQTERAADRVETEGGQPRPATYSKGEDDYRNLVTRDDVDLVYIATPWEWHYPMAKAALRHGKHVAVELPIATRLDDIWDLVRASEQTRKHCWLLENCNYGREELRVLTMVKQGLFGDLLHGSGGYVHDLRNPYLFHGAYYPEGWRRKWHTRTNASHYPMHGLAPVGACMDVTRGDRFVRLVSVASPAFGLALYRKEHMPRDHPSWKDDYISGDRNTCFIETAKGRFLRAEHEVSTPHPYSRANTLVGTRGVWSGDPQRIYLETLGHANHTWRDFNDDFKNYDHWLWTDVGPGGGGHGGMDYISLWRTIQLMRLGLTPDIDVYDSASWCSVVPLSERSLKIGSRAVAVPDFTRGHWKKPRPGLSRGRPTQPATARS
ncbi:Gfo/Idh/MocA family protein [Actinomadura sp. 1N219]|uniref:Gfo/Idh/MocA family protein n=1 Tax=Actinomadura sp. 1N219 TaxID=3375152 RepID=UPI00379BCEA2